ncbi:MAG: DUF4405 domain-containing protein [Planctomycetota bacterium]
MRRSTLNLVVDAVTLLIMLAVAATGLILRYVLPPGSRGGAGLRLWEWTRHDWGDFHFYFITGMAGLLLLHITLHWAWICGVLRAMLRRPSASSIGRGSRWNSLYGGITFAILVGAVAGFLWFASLHVEGYADGGREESDHRAGQQWRGGR